MRKYSLRKDVSELTNEIDGEIGKMLACSCNSKFSNIQMNLKDIVHVGRVEGCR